MFGALPDPWIKFVRDALWTGTHVDLKVIFNMSMSFPCHFNGLNESHITKVQQYTVFKVYCAVKVKGMYDIEF